MQRSQQTPCSSIEFLQRYLREQLDESEELLVRQHIDECESCQRALELAAADASLWQDVGEHLDPKPPKSTRNDIYGVNSDGELEGVRSLLGPTDDPAMLGRVGAYEVCGVVGRGSTGIVLKALEPRLGRYVAIKLLSPRYEPNGVARKRFEREGRAVAAISHEHVVPIYAVDEHRGLPYIVMKYVAGPSLQQRIEDNGPLDSLGVTRVALQVASALSSAHAQGIIHRDVKPANVILEANVDRAMVTDFGLARLNDEASMTRSGTITGTPQYMSPEQAKGESIDPRSDLFSLGSLMYYACTGRAPFRAQTVFGVIHRVCESEPRPIRELNPAVSGWLAAFVQKLMAKRPGERFESAMDVVSHLTAELAYLQNPTGVARPAREWLAPTRVRKATRRVAAFALVGVAALSAAGFAFLRERPSPDGGGATASLLGSTLQDSDGGPLGSGLLADAEMSWSEVEVDSENEPVVAFEQVLSRTFPTESIRALRVRVDDGDVLLRSSDTDELTVRVERCFRTEDRTRAEELAAHHEVDLVSERGSLIFDAGFDAEFVRSRLAPEIEYTRFVFSVPNNGQADVFAVHGDVSVEGVSASVRVRTSSGDVFLGENPGAVSVQTTGGDVVVEGITGPLDGHIEDGDAMIRLPKNPTPGAHLSVASGDIGVLLADGVAADVYSRGNLESSFPDGGEADDFGIGEPWTITRCNGGGAKLEVSSPAGDVLVETYEPIESATFGASALAARREGLGGSGESFEGHRATRAMTAQALEKTSGDPRPGALATVELPETTGNVDGYTLYLPVSYDTHEGTFPAIVYLQGAYGVGGEISDLNNWGLPRLLRDESDLNSERNRLLLDGFIIACPHITGGGYDDHPEVMKSLVDTLISNYKADPDRVALTGLSSGGHGSWGLAARLPGVFSAIAPIAGNANSVRDFSGFRDTSIWIAHNSGDGIVPYESALDAALAVEDKAGVHFLQLDGLGAIEDEYLSRRYVFTTGLTSGHDSWTDTYTGVGLYRWLQRQVRRGHQIEIGPF